jgi:alpha-glucosidase (family GH31 glycosyl hydrolase)
VSRPTGTFRFETASATIAIDAWNGGVELEGQGAESAVLRIGGTTPLRISFSKGPREHLVGLGERFVRTDQLGRMIEGRVRDLFEGAGPEDTYFYVPILYSSAGYAVLAETHAQCLWDLGVSDPARWSVWVPEPSVRLRLFRGTPKRLVELVTGVSGRAPLAEPWMYGVWKTALSGTEAVLREGGRLADAGIPVTALWTYDYFDGETNSGCGLPGTYPVGQYPDLPALNRGIHDQGLRSLGYVQPIIVRGTPAFAQALERGYLVRRPDGRPYLLPWWFDPVVTPGGFGPIADAAAPLDFTDPAAARWYSGLVHRHLEYGFDGWMEDFGEQIPDDARFADGTTGFETHNRYPVLYHEAAHAGWRESGVRATFSRSGGLGSIRHQPVIWPGDQYTDWTPSRGLGSVIPAGISIGLVGGSAWGPDIYGLADHWDGGAGAGDEELWVRGCQLGALSPVMRDHGGYKFRATTPVDLWASARTGDTFRALSELHLRLNPYLWALAEEAASTGVPVMRGLFLQHPDHEEAWIANDEYLLGSDLLVAPVHEPGATTRRLWLPPGEWADWWTGERREGPGMVTVEAPLERIPLFQRAGSSIPMRRVADPRLDPVGPEGIEQRRA